MTDITAVEAQSIHVDPIRENLPGWFAQSSLRRKQELAGYALDVPDFYLGASDVSKQKLMTAYADAWSALNTVDRVFEGVKDCAGFCEPLLVKAIKDEFNLELNVNTTFFARKVYYVNPLSERNDFGGAFNFATNTGGAPSYFYQGVTLLEAALANFDVDEAKSGACTDCRLLTRFDFHDAASEILPTEFAVKQLSLGVEAHRFASLCRTLDLGKQYQAHVTAELASIDASGSRALGTLVNHQKAQLQASALIARERGHIREDTLQMLGRLIAGEQGITWRGAAISCYHPRIEFYTVAQVLLILVGSAPIEHCLVYIPGDPDKPLAEYTSIWQIADDFAYRLLSSSYRVFFSQFIGIEQQHGFFAALKQQLDPTDRFNATAEWRVDSRAGLHRPRVNIARIPAYWPHCAQQKLDLIRSNAKALAVSTDSKDTKARRDWLQAVGSAALEVFNLASFVVPGLGVLMMAVGAVQMLYEAGVSVAAMDRGETRAMWEHISGLALNLAFAVTGHAVIPALRESDYVKGWVQVVSPQGKGRLIKPDWSRHQQALALPQAVRPDSLGLYAHDGKQFLSAPGGTYYEMLANGDEYRINHPTDPHAYKPRSRHNGAGAWVHEFEQPQQWDRLTLMRRIGYAVDGLSDEQLEQVRQISGISDDQLRRIYIDLSAPPPLLSETLRRFQINRRYSEFYDQMCSDDPQVYGRANIDLQLELLTHSEIWPPSRGLTVTGGPRGATVRQAPPGSEARAQVAISGQRLRDGALLETVVAELDDDELKILLGEDTQEARLRDSINRGERLVAEAPANSGYKSLLNFARQDLAELLQRPRDLPATLQRLRLRLALVAGLRRKELLNWTASNDDAAGQWLQAAFPDLPVSAVNHLLAEADDVQLEQLSATRRPPLKLSQEAREYLDAFRLQRAYEGMYLDEPVKEDTVRLSMHTLAGLPGWSGGMCFELRDLSYTGPLLDRVGDAKSATRRGWVKHADGTVGNQAYPFSAQRFYDSVFEWLPRPEREVMIYPLENTWRSLRDVLRRRAPDPKTVRETLNMPAEREDSVSSMGQAPDSRVPEPASRRALQCQHEARTLYPESTLAQIEEYLNTLGQSDAFMLKEIRRRRAQFQRLDAELTQWAATAANRQTAAQRIRACFQRRSPRVTSNNAEFVGYKLDLSDLLVGQLPTLPIEMPHVSSLVLRNMRLSDDAGTFLSSFPALRHLVLTGNRLTRLPSVIGSMTGLTQLIVESNQLQLTAQSVAQLAGLIHMRALLLAGNPLGEVPDVSGMTRLNQLGLADCGLTQMPTGALELPFLRRLDLHGNRLEAVPELLFERHEGQNRETNLHANPWSQAAQDRMEAYRLRTGIAFLDRAGPMHVRLEVALQAWLAEIPASEREQCTRLWNDLREAPGAAAFFRVMADMTRSATFKLAPARPGLAEWVWQLLDDAASDQALREQLFVDADAPGTCVDQRTDVLFKLGMRALVHKAERQAGTLRVEASLVELGRGCFRLTALDRLVKADIRARGPDFDEDIEVDLVYRTSLADRLKLPCQPRVLAFGNLHPVAPQAISQAGNTVLAEEARPGALATFLVDQSFWEEHLRKLYAGQIDRQFLESSNELHAQMAGLDDLELDADSLAERREALGERWKLEEKRALVAVTEQILTRYPVVQA